MILTCEQCNTNYMVPDGSIGAAGRTVKCAKCGYSWLQMPKEDASAGEGLTPPPLAPTPIPSGSGLPVVVAKRAPLWMKILPIPLAVAASLLALVLYRDTFSRISFLRPLYQLIGVTDTRGVTVSDVAIQKFPREKLVDISIKGKVKNTSADARAFPLIRIALLDKNNNTIAAQLIKPEKPTLGPSEEAALNNHITRIPPRIQFIRIDVGNKFDLWRLENF